MKVTLITTLPSLEENKRIEDEAKKLGHEFTLIDLKKFGFSTINGKVEIDGFDDIVTDVVIVRGVFISIKLIAVLIMSLKEKGIRVYDNNFLEHRYSIDKVMDLLKLSMAKISIPQMVYSRDFDTFERNAKKLGYPLVLKSTRSGKGSSVFKAEDEEELKNLVGELETGGKNAKSFFLQEFIPYKHDLRCLVIGRDVFTMKRIPARGEFRANFSLGGEVEVFDLDEKGKELALSALSSINMSVGGVDILITEDDKRYILEVNHTAGFVGMEKATDKNIGKLYVEHALKHAS
ncbi:RimK family alpha-L-glutamate ligase [Patescibacteria group bacterium]